VLTTTTSSRTRRLAFHPYPTNSTSGCGRYNSSSLSP